MRLFPPCEVMTRRSGLRLLAIWGLGGGGGDLAGTTFPRLLPLETVRRPGEALALVYPLAAGGKRCEWTGINRKIQQVNASSGVRHSDSKYSSTAFSPDCCSVLRRSHVYTFHRLNTSVYKKANITSSRVKLNLSNNVVLFIIVHFCSATTATCSIKMD